MLERTTVPSSRCTTSTGRTVVVVDPTGQGRPTVRARHVSSGDSTVECAAQAVPHSLVSTAGASARCRAVGGPLRGTPAQDLPLGCHGPTSVAGSSCAWSQSWTMMVAPARIERARYVGAGNGHITCPCFQLARSVVWSICRPIRSEIRSWLGGHVNVVTFRWVARGAGVLCASAALIFGLAGASAAAPAVVPPSNTTPAGNTVQMPDDEDIERCRDNKARTNDADL